MKLYSTHMSQIEYGITVYVAYVVDDKPVIVEGQVQAVVNLGNVGGERPKLDENEVIPPPAFAVVEPYRMWLPYVQGKNSELIFNGPIQYPRALVGQNDWLVLKAAESVIKEFVDFTRTEATSTGQGIPILFADRGEAEAFLADPESKKLAAACTQHYAQAFQATTRTIQVGFGDDGKHVEPTQEIMAHAKTLAEESGLQAPDAPAKINHYAGEPVKEENPQGTGNLTAAPGIPGL